MAVPMYHYYLCNSTKGKVLFQVLRPAYQNALQQSENKAYQLLDEKLTYLQYHYVTFFKLDGIAVVGEYVGWDDDEEYAESLADYELRLFQKAGAGESMPEKLTVFVRKADEQNENYPFQILQIRLSPSIIYSDFEQIEVDFWAERKYREAITHIQDYNIWNIETNPNEPQFYW